MIKNFEIKNIEVAHKRPHFQNLLFFSRDKEHEKKNCEIKNIKIVPKRLHFQNLLFFSRDNL